VSSDLGGQTCAYHVVTSRHDDRVRHTAIQAQRMSDLKRKDVRDLKFAGAGDELPTGVDAFQE
jgi:hypothetical protein